MTCWKRTAAIVAEIEQEAIYSLGLETLLEIHLRTGVDYFEGAKGRVDIWCCLTGETQDLNVA